jgi:hypothetical protein
MHEQPSGTDPGPLEGDGSHPLPAVEEPLSTLRLAYFHRAADFRCGLSERINSFLVREAPTWTSVNYCRVFVFPNPEDPTEIWGYYTLSPTELPRNEITGSHQKKVPKGIPVPLQRIGFMGRHDGAPKGLGAGLVYDAALRVYREGTGWGLTLDVEGGLSNLKLVEWYEGVGFTHAKTRASAMYAPLQRFLPELAGKPPKMWPAPEQR